MSTVSSILCCINSNCSLTKNCTNEVSHCKFVGKPLTNTTYGYLIRPNNMDLSHFDCWPWSHEARLCPNVAGHCFSVYKHSLIKIFCCSGNLCNNPQNLTCELKDNDVTWNPVIFPFDNSTPTISTDDTSNRLTKVIIIVLFVIVSGFVLIILCVTCKKKFSKVYYSNFKQPIPANGVVSSVSDWTTYMSRLTNGNCSVNQLDAFSTNEIVKASECYEKCEKKYMGKFGEIWSGRLKSATSERSNENVAIKVFRSRDISSWETELEMYRHIKNRCQTILFYIGCDKIMNHNEVTELWLVTSYIDLGSLFDYLVDPRNPRPNWSQVMSVCIDIASGLSYLHEDGSYQSSSPVAGKPSIAHRDLKSRNILMRNNWSTCIADLGLAMSFHGCPSPTELHLQVGTQRYMAPEVLEGSIHFSRDSFLAIDMYAMALILWEVLSQCHDSFDPSATAVSPFMAPFDLELGPRVTMEALQSFVVTENRRPQMPEQCRAPGLGLELWRTINECWDRDSEARLSASCVCQRLVGLRDRSDSRSMPTRPETEPLL